MLQPPSTVPNIFLLFPSDINKNNVILTYGMLKSTMLQDGILQVLIFGSQYFDGCPACDLIRSVLSAVCFSTARWNGSQPVPVDNPTSTKSA